MRPTISTLILPLCWALVLIGLSAAPTQAAPLEAYGRLPSIEQVQVSPAGDRLAIVFTHDEQRLLVVETVAPEGVAPTLLAKLNLANTKVRSMAWADNRHLMITTSLAATLAELENSKEEWYGVSVLDVDTGKQRGLIDANRLAYGMNVVLGEPDVRIVNGRVYAFSEGYYFAGHIGTVALIRTDMETGQNTLIEEGSESTNGWLVGADGQPVAETRYVPKTGDWSLRVKTTDKGWVTVRTAKALISPPYLSVLGRDGKTIVVRSDEADGTGKSVFYEVALKDGVWGPASPDPYGSLVVDPATNNWIGGTVAKDEGTAYVFFDLASQAAWKAVEKAFEGSSIERESWSADRRKIVVLVDNVQDGPAYYLVDLNTGRALWVGDVYEGLKAADLSEVKPIAYKARDGLEITGYLTLPKGRAATGLPLVVLPHGGPASRDYLAFDWWAQAYASLGYAVLQPNFRGSDGLGWDFLSAGFGQWGRKMQTDLSDGVVYLASTGVIDPKRVCIVGGSYGGYAALAGAAFDPGVYRCAVSDAGPADLRAMLATATREDGAATTRYWARFMGVKNASDPALDAISPAKHAEAVTIPILLIHGRDDTVVRFEQSQIMADALRRAGKPVTLVPLTGEDHWLSRGETRLEMLKASAAFLQANNPPN